MKLGRMMPGVLAVALLPFSMSVGLLAQTSTTTTTTTTAGNTGASRQAQQQARQQAEAKAQAQALGAANNPNKMNINTASLSDLKTLPGIGDAYAQRIVKGRPYQNKAQLATRGVLPQGVYDKVKLMIVASQK